MFTDQALEVVDSLCPRTWYFGCVATGMKSILVLAFAACLSVAQTQNSAPTDDTTAPAGTASVAVRDANINSRYLVESVGIANSRRYHISRSLVEDMQNLVGRHFNSDLFQSLASRISNELHGHQVLFRLTRGTEPDRVRVTFEVTNPKTGLDLEAPRLVYNSREGASAEGDAILSFGANTLTFAVLSDGDSMVERASGIRARFDRLAVGSERVRLGFEFDSYHEQYNSLTESAAAEQNNMGALYRTRRNFEPCASFVIAGPLTWTVGLSFQQFEQQFPSTQTASSDAIVSDLRYDNKWDDSTAGRHHFSAGYSIRVATTLLGGAFAYTRHAVDATYHWKRGHQSAELAFLGGAIAGRAPLFDRFVLGTSSTLRGWDKYEIDPLGGSRVVYGSAGYGYRMMRAFYDTGAIWEQRTNAQTRQSVGLGVKVEGVLLAVAFPIRSDHIEPVFIAGMNF